jgi:hypothetical protein
MTQRLPGEAPTPQAKRAAFAGVCGGESEVNKEDRRRGSKARVSKQAARVAEARSNGGVFDAVAK